MLPNLPIWWKHFVAVVECMQIFFFVSTRFAKFESSVRFKTTISGWISSHTCSGSVVLCKYAHPNKSLFEVKADILDLCTANRYFDPNCKILLLGLGLFLWGSESGLGLFVCFQPKIDGWSIDSPSAFRCWCYQSCPVSTFSIDSLSPLATLSFFLSGPGQPSSFACKYTLD